jgi:BirA family biotin operon repressor/biotin-[acetyl-CoA-carboxylase] ligase
MSLLGSRVVRFLSVTSTNEVARQMAAEGAEEGVAILARSQTAGRGTKGRAWHSPARDGLYLSLILKPRIKAAGATILTLAAAVGVAETLLIDFDAEPDIKWPNDVLLSGRKVCGILVESASEGDALVFAVLGIGVNLAQQEFPAEISSAATSLMRETSRLVTPDDFLRPLLSRLNYWYDRTLAAPSLMLERYQELSTFARGCTVRAVIADTDPVSVIEGITRGITATGALMIETAGTVRTITSGEIDRIRRTSSERRST